MCTQSVMAQTTYLKYIYTVCEIKYKRKKKQHISQHRIKYLTGSYSPQDQQIEQV